MKRASSLFVVLAATLACFVIAGMANSRHDNNQNRGRDSRVIRGLEISPVRVNLSRRNVESVGLGSYLINAVGSCNDCHTCPSYRTGHNPYLGEPKPWINTANFLAGGVPFGPFTSANLTPDSHGRPAGLTLQQFTQAIRTGHDPHPEAGHPPLLQVMPWPILRNMTSEDLDAIYAYLSAIPPAQPGSCTGAGE